MELGRRRLFDSIGLGRRRRESACAHRVQESRLSSYCRIEGFDGKLLNLETGDFLNVVYRDKNAPWEYLSG